jgi:2-oxoacid:acceptor oxidoreductase delta subunit (pyruvate/2-ketoisovalerate family)
VSELRPWQELPAGGRISPASAPRPVTAGWRTGFRPEAELTSCINCLLCWLYCPDSAITLDGTTFTGFDQDVCKGCELCAEVCPTGAITMVAEDPS